MLSFFHAMVQEIEDFAFAAGPEWGDQQVFGTVSGDAVNHNVGTEMFEAVDEKGKIFLPFVSAEQSVSVARSVP